MQHVALGGVDVAQQGLVRRSAGVDAVEQSERGGVVLRLDVAERSEQSDVAVAREVLESAAHQIAEADGVGGLRLAARQHVPRGVLRRVEVKAVLQLLHGSGHVAHLRLVASVEAVDLGFRGIDVNQRLEHRLDARLLERVGVQLHHIVLQQVVFLLELYVARPHGAEHLTVVGYAVALILKKLGTSQVHRPVGRVHGFGAVEPCQSRVGLLDVVVHLGRQQIDLHVARSGLRQPFHRAGHRQRVAGQRVGLHAVHRHGQCRSQTVLDAVVDGVGSPEVGRVLTVRESHYVRLRQFHGRVSGRRHQTVHRPPYVYHVVDAPHPHGIVGIYTRRIGIRRVGPEAPRHHLVGILDAVGVVGHEEHQLAEGTGGEVVVGLELHGALQEHEVVVVPVVAQSVGRLQEYILGLAAVGSIGSCGKSHDSAGGYRSGRKIKR